MPGWHWDGGPDGWAWIWMGLMMLLVWLPLLVLLIWGLRRILESPRNRTGPPDGGEVDAIELAGRAYARGEIDRERYLEIVRDLRETRGSRSGPG